MTDIITRTLGVSAAIVAALSIKYPDRAVFDEERLEIPHKKGWPLVGNLPNLLWNSSTLHDFILAGYTNLNTQTM